MESIRALGSTFLSYPFVNPVLQFGLAALFLKNLEHVDVNTAKPLNFFNTTFNADVAKKVATTAAFLFTSERSLSSFIPATIRTSSIVKNAFNRLATYSLKRYLFSSQTLIIAPLAIGALQWIDLYYSSTPTETKVLLKTPLAKIGLALSGICFAKTALIAFTKIGNWKQTTLILPTLVALIWIGTQHITGEISDHKETVEVADIMKAFLFSNVILTSFILGFNHWSKNVSCRIDASAYASLTLIGALNCLLNTLNLTE